MKLLKSQADETTLTNFGAKAAQLIKEQKYCELVEKFGYALAHDREKAEAVREDMRAIVFYATKNRRQIF